MFNYKQVKLLFSKFERQIKYKMVLIKVKMNNLKLKIWERTDHTHYFVTVNNN